MSDLPKTDAKIQSVSAGGESVTIDTEAAKAEQRSQRNNSLKNVANRRVRPLVSSMRIRHLPGW